MLCCEKIVYFCFRQAEDGDYVAAVFYCFVIAGGLDYLISRCFVYSLCVYVAVETVL